MADYIGLIAGGIVTLGLVPQVIRVYKLKSAREISAMFNILFLVGMVLFTIYGVMLNLRPIVFWNCIGMVLMSALLFGKFKYGRQ